MAAATTPRNTQQALGNDLIMTTAAAIIAGTLVCADANGLAVPAADTAGFKVIGIAYASAIQGATVRVRRGTFLLENDTAQPVTAASIGKLVYILDNQTVTIAAGATALVPAGKFLGFEAATGECIVEIGNGQIRGNVAPIVALAGTVTGTADGTMENIAATAGSCAGGATPTATQVDTAIATAVASIVTGTNLQLKELLTKVNLVIASMSV